MNNSDFFWDRLGIGHLRIAFVTRMANRLILSYKKHEKDTH